MISLGQPFARGWWARACLALWLMLLAPVMALAQEVAVPALSGRVVDDTATLDAAQRQALESKLAALEQATGAQVAVLLVPTTGDDSVEQFATRTMDSWKLGRKDVDDGILLLIAKNDRTARIEVGYGLEGVVNDATANRILQERVLPRFGGGDFNAGIDAGVDALAALVRKEDLPAPSVAPAAPSGQDEAGWSLSWIEALVLLAVMVFKAVPAPFVGVAIFLLTGNLWIAVLGALLALVVNLVLHRVVPRSVSGGNWSSGSRSAGSRRSGGWRSSGSSGRSSGGGFSGGGGRSGGGGASGRW